MKHFLIWALTAFYPIIVMEKTQERPLFEDEKGNIWQVFSRKKKGK